LEDHAMSDLRAIVQSALREAIEKEVGPEPISRSELVRKREALRRVFENTPSPDRNIVSDVKYRALVFAELDAIYQELDEDSEEHH
jgi:hypothetical protein